MTEIDSPVCRPAARVRVAVTTTVSSPARMCGRGKSEQEAEAL